MLSYENIAKQKVKVYKCLKYKKLKRKHIILGKYINIFIFYRKKIFSVVDFTSVCSCFRIPGSLFLPRILN